MKTISIDASDGSGQFSALVVEPAHTPAGAVIIIQEIFGVNAAMRAMAQYAVGHRERMKRISAHVAALPGLRLAGNAYDGIGVPDCIRLGRKAARDLAGVLAPPQSARV